jgi:hypothetical protein
MLSGFLVMKNFESYYLTPVTSEQSLSFVPDKKGAVSVAASLVIEPIVLVLDLL